MELKGKKVVILAEEMYNEFELWYPFYRLIEAGAEVMIAGPQGGQTFSSKHGLPVTTDLAAEAVDPGVWDAIVIPGGYAPDYMRRTPAMVELVSKMAQAGRVVAAICHAGWMLASAEVVKGKTVTSFFGIKDDLIHAGAEWVDQEVVVDDNLITSRTPDDLPAFCRAIIAGLTG